MTLPEWWPSDKPWIIGDCLEGMRGLPDNVIDLTVTSPPYDDLRTYGGFVFDFEGIAKELYRITKDGGIVVWVVGDETKDGSETGTSFKQALYFKEIGFNLHDTMIYEKSGFSNPSNDRYHQIFEYMFILSVGKPKSFNPIKDKKNKSTNAGKSSRQRNGHMANLGQRVYYGKYGQRTNIWRYKTGTANSELDENTRKHPAIFPQQLATDHIISWSDPGQIVLDPFLGSGTTLLACRKTDRIGLGFEINPDYEDIIRKRSLQDIRPLEDYFDQGYVPEKEKESGNRLRQTREKEV